MAKYCIGCGAQLPDSAKFCPECGTEQKSVPQSQKDEFVAEIEDDEEDEDELGLLSSLGYISKRQEKKPPFTPTNKQDDEKEKDDEKEQDDESSLIKNAFGDYEDNKDKEKDNEHEKLSVENESDDSNEQNAIPQDEQFHGIVIEDDDDVVIDDEEGDFVFDPSSMFGMAGIPNAIAPAVKKENVEKKENRISDYTGYSKNEEKKKKEDTKATNTNQAARKHSQRKHETQHENKENEHIENHSAPFEPTSVKKKESLMPEYEEKEEQYDLPDDFSLDYDDDDDDDDDEVFISAEEAIAEATRLQEEQKKREEGYGTEPSISAKTSGHVPTTKRRNLSEKDEEDIDFNQSAYMQDDTPSMMTQNKMYADEVEDEKKRAMLKEEVDDEDDDDYEPRRRGAAEGRKQVNTQHTQRRRSQRDEDINKKVYDIEQDMSSLDPEEKNYDGYYESVLPMDFGKEEKRKIDPKMFGIVALVIGIAIVAIIVIMLIL